MRDEFLRKQGTEQLLLHIDEALMVIEPKMRHSLQGVDGIKDIVSFDNDPVQQQLASEKVRKIVEFLKKRKTIYSMRHHCITSIFHLKQLLVKFYRAYQN